METVSSEASIGPVEPLQLFGSDDDPTTRVAPVEAPIPSVGLVALDWETDGWHAYDGVADRRISRAEMLRTRFDVEVVCEAAHLHPRVHGSSLAQVYTVDELAALLFRPLVFQQREIRKAARHAGTGGETKGEWKQDKKRDAEAIWRYLTDHPRKLAALKRYELPGEERSRHLWDARDAYRASLLADLNQARFDGGSKDYERLPMWCEIRRRVQADFYDIPQDTRTGLGLLGLLNSSRIEPLNTVVYTCWALARDADGQVRLGPNGRPLGWGFIRGAVGLSHSRVPNIARSQLTHWGLRVYMGRRAGTGKTGKHMPEEWRNQRRAEFTRYVRDLVRFFQYDPTTTAAPAEAPIGTVGQPSKETGQ
jgi:hypothetical protein